MIFLILFDSIFYQLLIRYGTKFIRHKHPVCVSSILEMFSTLGGYHEYIWGDTMSTSGDITSTSGDIMSTSGDFMTTSGGYHDVCGGYHEYIRGFHEYIGGIS